MQEILTTNDARLLSSTHSQFSQINSNVKYQNEFVVFYRRQIMTDHEKFVFCVCKCWWRESLRRWLVLGGNRTERQNRLSWLTCDDGGIYVTMSCVTSHRSVAITWLSGRHKQRTIQYHQIKLLAIAQIASIFHDPKSAHTLKWKSWFALSLKKTNADAVALIYENPVWVCWELHLVHSLGWNSCSCWCQIKL